MSECSVDHHYIWKHNGGDHDDNEGGVVHISGRHVPDVKNEINLKQQAVSELDGCLVVPVGHSCIAHFSVIPSPGEDLAWRREVFILKILDSPDGSKVRGLLFFAPLAPAGPALVAPFQLVTMVVQQHKGVNLHRRVRPIADQFVCIFVLSVVVCDFALILLLELVQIQSSFHHGIFEA